MSSQNDMYRPQEYTMADRASTEERAQFIVRTYLHLFGAVIAFVLLETFIQLTPIADGMYNMLAATRFGWLAVLGAFVVVSHVANKWAHGSVSLGQQYAALILYVVAEAIIFAPLIYMALVFTGPEVIINAAMATSFIFAGLTAVVFITRKNFSFMGPFLGVMGLSAMAIIVVSIIFGFNLGVLFSVAMIAFSSGYILYNTSNVMHEYNTNQYVAASLTLFAAVALLFWYILRLFMSRD